MKSLEIFSGVGGLAKGLELAGFSHSALIELNKDACASLRHNFRPDIVFEADVTDFDLSGFDAVDLIAGGLPCQPFSLGGKHKAHQDSRDMFPDAVRYIDHFLPKAFFFENVKGILRASFAEYFDYIILSLTFPNCRIKNNETWESHLLQLRNLTLETYHGVRYRVSFKLLNAADYGVPQKRERVVIIGVRSDQDQWQFPEPTHSQDRLNWDKYVTGVYWQKHGLPVQKNNLLAITLEKKYGIFAPPQLPWITIRDALLGVPCPNEVHNIPDHILKNGARIYPGHTGSDIDQPSKTIKAGGHGVPGGENMIRYPCGSVRYFTTHEAKLIQTFPRDFIVTGAWGEAMRQIGNAVPVKLAEVISQQLYQKIC